MTLPSLLLALLLPAASLAAPAEGPLQVPSPDWRDQVVYFLLTDRFMNGDPRNDDQGHGDFKPTDANFYSGGDFAGLLSKLDYIRGLGATAVWLTPPVANVWWDSSLKMSGYHGYWAVDFKATDRHLGTLEDYRRLSRELHRRGMYLVQDIVGNHTADFFYYEGTYDPADPAKGFRLKEGMFPPRPAQPPFSHNDLRDPAQRAAGAYHWTPDIQDYNDEGQRLHHQMSGLDDLNTSDPRVREALRDAYGFWIATAGVDGFRIDTAHFAEHDFWKDLLHSTSPAAPGIDPFARALGKKDFMTFGEVWVNGDPFSDKGERAAVEYLGTQSSPEMRAVLNFPLAMELRAVFAKGAPPARLRYRLENLKRFFAEGSTSVNFIDNHDMARFLAEGTEGGFVQALTALLTLPGLPVVYAGTEQAFTETRGAMFAGGYGSGGKDRFDPTHPLYLLLRELTDLRRREPVFRRGTLVPLYGASAGPGPFAYRLDAGKDRALVLFNTADEEVLLARLETGLPEGTPLDALFARGFAEKRLRLAEGGRLSLRMPARSVLVLKGAGTGGAAAPSSARIDVTGFTGLPTFSAKTSVEGTSRGVAKVSVVVDGRLARALPAKMLGGGRWRATLDPALLPDGEHSLLAVDADAPERAPSEEHAFKVSVPFTLVKEITDPVGDDHGPAGTYRYPLAQGFEGRADLEKLSLYRRGPGAKLVLKLADGVTSGWNPAFGFDHVCFDVYVGFPESVIGRPGATRLPRLNAGAPAGFSWHYAAFLGGWKAALYDSAGAGDAAFGPQVQPAPKVSTDKAAGTVSVLFDLDAFKGVPSFDGARFYLTTWDYDGMEGTLRPLAPQAGDYVFGGGKPGDPRIMDDALLAP
ncbi:MAG: alpha-amylase family glycosyl hydrolase [Elusimicrobiota bacterium]|jgi:glycosidase